MLDSVHMIRGIGIDAVDISRFNELSKSRDELFLKNNFQQEELDYCFSYKDPAPHLAGTFAAKEAVAKALDAKSVFFPKILIRRGETGAPKAILPAGAEGTVLVSITHTETTATAIAVAL